MMMFGSGASTCATTFDVDVSRLNEVTAITVPAGTTQAARRPEMVSDDGADYAAFSFPHSKLVPLTQMQWSRTAILRATATFAFFIPIRFDRRVPQAFSVDHFFVRCMSTLAAS